MPARNLSVSARYSSKYACTPAAITSCRFAHAVLRVLHAVLSRGWARKSCRAYSLVVHAMLKAAEGSADSHHSRLRCRRGVGGTSASTASVMVVVNSATIPVVLRAWKGWLGLEMTLAIIRSQHLPSNINICRSKGRPYLWP